MVKITKIDRESCSVTQVRFRCRGIEDFSLSFTDYDVAVQWVKDNSDEFHKDPGKYFRWLSLLKKEARDKGEYTLFGKRMELIIDHIICTRSTLKQT